MLHFVIAKITSIKSPYIMGLVIKSHEFTFSLPPLLSGLCNTRIQDFVMKKLLLDDIMSGLPLYHGSSPVNLPQECSIYICSLWVLKKGL